MMISGLASGIDTEELISQMMAIERRPMLQMQERTNKLQERMNAFRDINMRLSALRSRVGDIMSLSSFESKTAGSSDASVATATASTSASIGRYDLVVEKLATAHRIASGEQEDASSALDLIGTFKIDDVEVEVTEDMSLRDIRDAINASDSGVRASIVSATLVLEGEKTGVAHTIQLEDTDGDVLQALGLLDGAGDIAKQLQAAQDAEFSINGLEFTRGSNVVGDLVDGVTFTLRSEGSTSISVEQDINQTVNAIQAFVDQYNSSQKFIGERLQMGGLLQGDLSLMQLQSSLQMQATNAVAPSSTLSHNALSSIGITVNRDREMIVDVDRLREALQSNPEEVRMLLTGTNARDGLDGVATRMSSFLDTYTRSRTGILSSRQQMYQDQVNSLRDSMQRLEDRLEIRERNLRRQFIAMEEAIASLHNLSVAMAGQLTQLQGFMA